MKKYLLAFSLLAVSTSLLAEVKLGESGVSANGSVELDLFGRTNTTGKDGKDTTTSAMEIATTLNIDGKHDSDMGYLIWRVATKIATDWRYDSLGFREAWAGVDGKYGKFIAGNQFSTMYLTMDWPYGAQGMGNLFGDLGAHEVQYSRAISYTTPNLAGFTLNGQYDIGGYGENQNTGEINHSYAYEASLNYNNNGLRADLGYYMGKNNGTLDYTADAFNGARGAQASAVSALENTASVYLAALKYNIGAFDFNLAYKYNLWDGELNDGSFVDKMNNSDALVRVGYSFLEKNKIDLGYQMITETKDEATSYYSAVNTVNFQYTRTISQNAVAFLQVRHHMFDSTELDHMWIDAHQGNQDSATRFLIGYWVGF
jgi:predicted porin